MNTPQVQWFRFQCSSRLINIGVWRFAVIWTPSYLRLAWTGSDRWYEWPQRKAKVHGVSA